MKCPYCDEDLEIDNWFNSSFDEDRGVFYVAGWCPSCFKDFIWERHYILKEEKELSEVKGS